MSGVDAHAPEDRLFGLRTRLVIVASTVYVAAAALRAAAGSGALVWACVVGAFAIAWRAGVRDRWTSLAEWGLAIAVASLGAPDAGGWVGVFGLSGGFAAAIAARVAIARVAAPEGIPRPRASRPWIAVASLAALAVVGVGSHVASAFGAHGWLASGAVGVGLVCVLAAFAILVAEAWRVSIVRRLELGVAARMHAAAGHGAAPAGIAIGLWFLGLAEAESIARVAVAVASVLVCSVTLRGDPVDLARASRRAIALTIVGGPILLVGAGVAQGRPWDSPAIVAIFGVVALAIGAFAPWIEEPLRPARGAWLDAVAAAHEALLRTDPDEAVREALVALRAPAGLDAASPELWTFDPLRVTTVDAAGYAHGGPANQTEQPELPDALVAIAAAEHEAILRLEVLDAFQVRRSELRPYARWMQDRGAMLAAVVTRAGEAEGLLVLPRGRRASALSLEEARAIKRLADALAALCHARASLARSLDRERVSKAIAEEATAALARANGELDRRAGVHVLAAERLARPATVGIYSAAARLAFDAIEGTLRAGRTLFVHAPPGTDPVPYVARAHLATQRRGEPLVVVDGTSTREHDPSRWRDPSLSPLALADRGLLLVVDGAALPIDVQRILARAHEERRAPWDADKSLEFALAMTSTAPLDALTSTDRLDPSLGARFAEAASCELPRLRDRPEDLRAIVSDRLAREGLRTRGVPVGIEDAAFARLLDCPFEGEDAELASMIQRLVTACDGDVIRARDIDAILTRDQVDERTRARA
jgi:hypothetical protein